MIAHIKRDDKWEYLEVYKDGGEYYEKGTGELIDKEVIYWIA